RPSSPPWLSDYTSGPSAKSINYGQRRIDVPRTCRDLNTLNRAPQLGGDLARDRNSLVDGGLRSVRRAHPVEQGFRYPHAGHFVGHELGVSRALERKQAGNDRQFRRLETLENLLEAAQVENRPRHDELGARLQLVFETAQLFVDVRGCRVHGHTDMKSRGRANWLPADVTTAVEACDQVRQADRVDVEHGGGVGIVADAPGVAGNEQQVAQSHRLRAEEIGLDAEQVPVAAGMVQPRLDAGLLLDEHGQRERARPCARALAVGYGDDVDTADFQRPRALD